VFIPILSESFRYTEERYFSPQIRQQVMTSDVAQGYYHIEGDIELEADVNYLPHLLMCTRHTPSFATGVYTFVPSTAGATSTAASGMVQRTCSITIVRNGIAFGYSGCTLGSLGFFVDAGVLKFRATLFGEKDNVVASPPTPTWIAASLFGADAHQVYVDASGIAPTFAGAAVRDFNGFEFTANHNPSAENRLVNDRGATYIAFHETEISVTTELDFVDKTEYDSFVANTQKAFKLESNKGGATFAAATQAVQIIVNRGVYETYDVGLSGLADLIMAGVTIRGIGIAGGNAYSIKVKSPVTIT
jgi:Phage tail tube protein